MCVNSQVTLSVPLQNTHRRTHPGGGSGEVAPESQSDGINSSMTVRANWRARPTIGDNPSRRPGVETIARPSRTPRGCSYVGLLTTPPQIADTSAVVRKASTSGESLSSAEKPQRRWYTNAETRHDR